MICGDMQSAKLMMDMRVEEAQRVARSRRLERRTGSGLWTWVQQQVCQILISLGHRLVIVGRRLERRSLPWHSL